MLSAQEDYIPKFLDSLDAHEIRFVEVKLGFQEKAEELLKNIDTTVVSREQIDAVIKYYEFKTVNNTEFTHPYLDWARRSAMLINYKKGLAEVYTRFGVIDRLTYKTTAEENNRKAFEIYKALDDHDAMAGLYTSIGLQYYSKADYESALIELFKALDHYKTTDNKARLVITYHNIGDTYLRLGDSVNVVKYLNLSNALEKRFPYPSVLAMNLSFLGEIHLGKQQWEKASKNFNKSNEIIDNQGVVPYLEYYNLKNLGIIEEANGNLIGAYKLYKEAFAKTYTIGSGNRAVVVASTKLANLLMTFNRHADALAIVERVEKKKIIDTPLEELSDADFTEFYNVLSKAFELNENSKKALEYKNKQVNALQAFSRKRIENEASELEKKYQSKFDKQEIQMLQDENKLRQRSFVIASLIFLGLISLLLFTIAYLRQRSKRLRQEKALVDLELENKQIKHSEIEQQQKITQLELELKNKELTRNSMSLLQKKEQYGHVISQLRELKPLIQNNETAKKKLNNIISDCLSSKSNYNWEEFKHTFENVHESFYTNILAKHPNLTPNEKKLSAFLKLGLNTKDISAITLQNTRTIVIARSRLRKKLNLPKDADLVNYISKF